MVYKDQIPWFATSNGVIDLKTSADFRDNRYTNNEIVNNNNNNSNNETNNDEKESSSKGSAKSQSKLMTKVMPGGLPPLPQDPPRPLTGPPPPKDNELYGDILVIPPIRQHQGLTSPDDPPPAYTRYIQVREIDQMQSGWKTIKQFIVMVQSFLFPIMILESFDKP